MNVDTLSIRQLAVCAFVGGLSAAASGAGYGWQGALLAVPVIAAAGLGLTALAPRWSRLEEKWTGRTLSTLYALWGAAMLGRGLARCASRVAGAGGAQGCAPWVMILVSIPLLWMAWGKPAAFFRASEIFYLAVVLLLAALLVWSGFRVHWNDLFLPAENLWAGFWAALETAGTFLFVLPYLNRAQARPGQGGRAVGWLALLAGAGVLMAAATVGVLSPAVAADSNEPFFLMSATLGRAVRVEGLAAAVWLLADLSLLGLFARSWQRTGTGKSWLPPVAVAAGAALALTGIPLMVPAEVWGMGMAALAVVTGAVLLAV